MFLNAKSNINIKGKLYDYDFCETIVCVVVLCSIGMMTIVLKWLCSEMGNY